MTNWIDDAQDLSNFPKVDSPVPSTNPINNFGSVEANAVRQALLDIQTWCRGLFRVYMASDPTKFAHIDVVITSPNGSRTAAKGSIVIDIVAAKIWQNTDGGTTWHDYTAGGGGGITNSAGNHTLMASDGTNAVASQITDPGGGGAITTPAPVQTSSVSAAALSAALGGVTAAMQNITAGASPSALPAAPTITNDWDPWSGGTRSQLVRVIPNQMGSVIGGIKGGSVGDVIILENHGDGSGNQAAGDLRIRFRRTTDIAADTGLITCTVAVSGGSTTYTRSAGDFVADGFSTRGPVTWVGYANSGNNITALTPTSVTSTVMTFATTTQVNEAGTGDEHATSDTVANHIYCPNLQDVVIPYTGAAVLYYDAANVGWIMIGLSLGGRINTLDASEIKISHPLTPSALAAGNNNDYDPSGGQWSKGQSEASWLRLNGDAGGTSVLTGLVQYASAGPSSIASQGPVKIIQNLGGPITISHEDANSSAAHRFNLPNGNIVIPPNGIIMLIYDMQGGGSVNAARWRVLTTSGMLSKLTLYKAITDTAMGTSVVDYTPTGLGQISRMRLAPSTTCNLHGMVAQEDGALRFVTAYGTGLTIKHQSSTETTAANRFYLSNAADIVLSTGGSAIFVYDATFGAWFCLGKV